MNSTIELRDIPEFEGLYAATRDGRIWSYKRKRFLRQGGEKGNYQIVTLSHNGTSRSYYAHRLVAMAFLPNPDNLPCVNHKDEHKDHNWAENLEWCTQNYNVNYGSRTLKMSKPVYCVELGKRFNSIYAAAKATGVHQGNLSSLLKHHKEETHTLGGYHWRYANK